ncbi:MAG TPA: hypothetical protein VN622_09060 [Clostridia bacterium]|nr:hypothetical protein [Clostridia bacterium]
MKRIVEEHYPIGAGLPLGLATGYLGCRFLGLTTAEAKDIFASMLNVSAIVAGFLGTAISILLAFKDKPVLMDLRELGIHQNVFDYLLFAVRWSFALAVISTCSIVLFSRLQSLGQAVLLAVWCCALWVSVLGFVRVILIFEEIVRQD